MTETAEQPVSERLLRGAAHMGRLWLKKIKAECGWAFACPCMIDGTMTEWCKAKALWFKLAVEDRRVTGETADGPFALIELMTVDEVVATKLTVTFDLPGLGEIMLGPKGQMLWETFFSLVKDQNGKSLETVFAVLKNFPGAKVVK
jgi:hypothetical protein